MGLPSFLSEASGGTQLRLKVQPRASRNEIGEPAGDELKVRITAPPVDSAANEALCRFLAEQLGCRRGNVEIIRGQTSRHKLIQISGMDPGEILARLQSE